MWDFIIVLWLEVVLRRVARIEGVLEEMSKRLNHIESGVANLRGEVKSEISSLRGLFRWSVGLMLGMWIIIQAALIPILLRILGAIWVLIVGLWSTTLLSGSFSSSLKTQHHSPTQLG